MKRRLPPEQKFYRIKQPLYAWKSDPNYLKSKAIRHLILSYDILYNFVFEPEDISPEDRIYNAKGMLEVLGNNIEEVIGTSIFDLEEVNQQSTQLEFDSTDKKEEI